MSVSTCARALVSCIVARASVHATGWHYGKLNTISTSSSWFVLRKAEINTGALWCWPTNQQINRPRSHPSNTHAHTHASSAQSNMGPGILFLPKAFSDGGLVFSSIGLLLVCVASTIGCLALLKCRQEAGGSYAQLAYGALGGPARVAVEFSLCTAQSGFCCVYLLFIAHNVRDVARHLLDCQTLPQSASILSLIFLQLIVLVPLTWIRRLKRLRVTNLLGELCVLFGLFYIIGVDISILTAGPNSSINRHATVKLFNPNDWGIFLGTAAYAYEGKSVYVERLDCDVLCCDMM
jgi:amino acid permease